MKKADASVTTNAGYCPKVPTFGKRVQLFVSKLIRQWPLIALCLPALALIIIFRYGPMYGILIAFKNYRPLRGIGGSAWLDPVFQNFTRFFNYVNFGHLITNTFKVGLWTLVITYPMPIIFAILLNELRGKYFKRSVQTVSYIPHFISVVVVVGMLTEFASLNGAFNMVRGWLGLAAVNMNMGSKYFLPMYIGSAVWQGVGWGSIVYLSALANVDTSLYDVANIDGANRWQKVKHIVWPAILPTTTVILILNTGSILNQDYVKILLMQNDSNRTQLDVISTYVYLTGIEQGQFGYATAVGLFSSLASFALVIATNMTVRKIDKENSLW